MAIDSELPGASGTMAFLFEESGREGKGKEESQ